LTNQKPVLNSLTGRDNVFVIFNHNALERKSKEWLISLGLFLSNATERLQVIVTYLVTLSIAETSRACLASYNCVDKYVRLFQHRATLSPLVSDNARPKKIPWWMEAYLLYRCGLQHLLLKRLYLAQGDVPSITAITNLFTNLRITQKKCVVVALERMSRHVLHCRRLFFQWRRTVDPRLVYFFRVLTARQVRDNMDELIRDLRAQASDLKVAHEVASIQL